MTQDDATGPRPPTSLTTYNSYAALPKNYLPTGATASSDQDVLEALGLSVPVQAAKVVGKVIALENPARESPSRRAAKARRLAEQTKKKRALVRGPKSRGLLPKHERKPMANGLTWDRACDLHRLWLSYMGELLGYDVDGAAKAGDFSPRPPIVTYDRATQTALSPTLVRSKFAPSQAVTLHAKLVKADFLGCLLTVRKATNSSLIGSAGIVVQETEGTFSVITQEKGIKVLPKRDTVFNFSIRLCKTDISEDQETLSFDISGNQFAHRAAERVGRKFKSRQKGEFAPWDAMDETFPA